MRGEKKRNERTLECWINLLNHVGREDKNTTIILDLTQEDRDERISRDIGAAPCLHKHIRLVQEQNGIPQLGQFENLRKLLVQVLRRSAQLSCTDDVQRPMGDFRYGLRREGLSASWVTAEKSDEAFALACDDVVEYRGLGAVLCDEPADELLVFIAEDELLEYFVRPGDFLSAIQCIATYTETLA